MGVSEETVGRRGLGSGHPVDLSSAKPKQGAEKGGSRVGQVPRSWDSSQAVTGTISQGWTSEMGSMEGEGTGRVPSLPTSRTWAEPMPRGATH